jgi:peptidoglycan/xylan/chitin deacetylase (PgdA/CDA1 family)
VRAILTWHSIDASGSPISVSPGEFQQQLRWLESGAVRVMSLESLLDAGEESPAVALTFDDGFANFASEAAPVLRQRGLPVTLFIVTQHVGRDNCWQGATDSQIPVLPLLDWDALGRLHEGGVDLAAHTRTHPHLRRLDGPQLEAELGLAAEEMKQRLGVRPAGLAYPYGDADDRLAETAARWYSWGCTTELKPLGPGDARLLLPRLDAWYLRSPARLDSFGSKGFLGWLWGRRLARKLRGH